MIQAKRNFVFDFDSTLTSVEALDVLAEISLVNNSKKDEIINEIVDITNLGIDGKISFTESLEKRIQLLNAKKSDLPILSISYERRFLFLSREIKSFLKIFLMIFTLFLVVLKSLLTI